MPWPSELPIAQAPLAGGPSTPALTAAVADAGAYGYVAGGYLTAEGLHQAITATRRLTGRPFGVNLFVPGPVGDAAEVARYAARLEPEAARLGVALGAPRWDDDAFAAKLEVARAAAVHQVSFTFGCPDEAAVERLHAAGTEVAVTVTSAAEAQAATAVGSDAVIVQGAQAGGHQGTFLEPGPNVAPLLTLLAEVRAATALPLVAAGGIMGDAEVAAALGAGAAGVQVGTALLCTPEAGTSPLYRRVLLTRRYPRTVVTRAFSGRWARGLANEFAERHAEQAPAAYPEVHHLTRPLRAAATEAGDPGVPNFWAGQGWQQVRSEPARAVIARLAAGARRA
jgi:nitronate monooxygenase